MKCKNLCGIELTGRQKTFCSDKCRMSHKRKVEQKPEHEQPEQISDNVIWESEPGAAKAIDRILNPDFVEIRQPLTKERQLSQKGFND